MDPASTEKRSPLQAKGGQAGQLMSRFVGKVRKLGLPVSPEVASFAVTMETFLRSQGKDNSESWLQVPTSSLIRQLGDKVKKLTELNLDEASPQELFSMCMLASCFLMMIAEQASKSRVEEKSRSSSHLPVVTLPSGKTARRVS
jgi:S-formylglutathione hydrolase FrmB